MTFHRDATSSPYALAIGRRGAVTRTEPERRPKAEGTSAYLTRPLRSLAEAQRDRMEPRNATKQSNRDTGDPDRAASAKDRGK